MWSIQKKSIREHDLRVLRDYLLEIDSRLDKGDGLPDDLPNHAKTFHDIGGIDRIFPRRLGVDSYHYLKEDISNDEIKRQFGIVDLTNFREQALLFKFDFQKAFDSLRWDHLDDILRKFGSVVNGEGGFVVAFVLQKLQSWLMVHQVTNSYFIERVIDRGMFVPILVGKNDLVLISQLFYVDDFMFIGIFPRRLGVDSYHYLKEDISNDEIKRQFGIVDLTNFRVLMDLHLSFFFNSGP
nr:hypothetical protein [Tanacetum cinerariifolium]